MQREQRIEGGLLGLLIGDALGVPYEFQAAERLPRAAELEMEPPPGFRRSHARVPVGTWSDDGAQALALLASLLDRNEVDVGDLARRFLDWYQRGAYTPDGHVFDIGVQTSGALRAIDSGTPVLEAALGDERSNGNGSLMRVLPLALWHCGTDRELVADAHLQSRVTHAHPRSQICCALYCLWAREELAGGAETWGRAVHTLRLIYGEEGDFRDELEFRIRPDDPPEGRGSGYVVDCLRSARMVCGAYDNYESIVKAAVALGDDTDTTACVAGGIAGIRHGSNSIPARWRQQLRGVDLVTPYLELLCARARRFEANKA